MVVSMNPLDKAMEEKEATAYVAYGSSADADILYLTHFQITDPLVYLKKRGEQGMIVVSSMEYERAKRESTARVVSRNEARFFEFLKEDPEHRERATARMIASLAEGNLLVPPQFPFILGKELENFFPVSVENKALRGMRALKSPDELGYLRIVQQATEGAMKAALSFIRKSRPKGDTLVYRNQVLTSEGLKSIIQKYLIDQGCLARDTIVSCGTDTALPHLTGKGPLHPDEPIIIDIFPRHEESGYFADMTRTVVRGEPSAEIAEMYQAVLEAQSRAASRIQAGITGADLHQDVVDFFKERGYESNSRGFMHNLGHGVGLDVHEAPVLGPGGEPLSTGNVVTVEPGLYYREYGGVRLEDMGAVEKNGFDRFTRCEEILRL
jgi:Xaa-Pro aminopeptidase